MSSLHGNHEKIQVIAFHPRNKEANRSQKVRNETELENTAYPKYLGVTLDRSLCYKKIHTEWENDGGYPQQPTDEISNFQVGRKSKYYQNDSFI